MSVEMLVKLLFFVFAVCMLPATFAGLGCSHNHQNFVLPTNLKVGYGINWNLTSLATAKCFAVTLLCNQKDTLNTTDGLVFHYEVDYAPTTTGKNIDPKFGFIAGNQSTILNMRLINEKTLHLYGNNHYYDQELLPSRCTADLSMISLILSGDVTKPLKVSFTFSD